MCVIRRTQLATVVCVFVCVHTRCLTVRLVDILNAQEPTIPGLRRGIPGSGDGLPNQMAFDTEKTKRILGVEWTSMEETAKELIDNWRERGWKAEKTTSLV